MDDLVGLGKASEKLLDVISGGIGTLYKPRAIRKEAEAKAVEIKLLGQAQTDVESDRIRQLGIAEAESRLVAKLPDAELLQRAKARLVYREMQRQENVENIAEEALKALPDNVSDETPDDDWRTRFFSIAEDVSNDDMQKLWGKVLAGEVAQPGSYSVRTLDVLRNMTKGEAVLFQKACRMAFQGGFILKIGLGFEQVTKEYGLEFSELLTLSAAGLMFDTNTLAFSVNEASISQADGEGKRTCNWQNNGLLMSLKGGAQSDFKFTCYSFTPAGTQLMALLEPNPNLFYLKALASSYKTMGYEIKKILIDKSGAMSLEDF